jgi:hypothetical protein
MCQYIFGMEPVGWKAHKFSRLRVLLCGAVFLFMTKMAFAAPQISTADPNYFFNMVAARLLNEELGMDLSAIPIYPTNQYTPAVHRLLQVTANILDCTTTNCYPSVFHPIFWKTNELIGGGVYQTNIYITGYQYVQEPLTPDGPPIFTLPTEAGDPTIPFGLSGMSNNIYGIPWVIGVKKGLPNFNALEMENCIFIERELQFTRNSTNPVPANTPFPFGRIYATNQMYIIGISNLLGVDFWNSYAAAFTNPVAVIVQDSLSLTLTNDAGVSIENNNFTIGVYFTNVWPGVSSSSSFICPLGTNYVVPLPLNPQDPSANNIYVYYYGPGPVTALGITFMGPCFIPVSLDPQNYLDSGTPPLPNFGVSITNRLQAYILDTNGYILDYVQLGGMNNSFNLNAAIADPDSSGLWSTNGFEGGNMPFGVYDQYFVSSEGGTIPTVDGDGGIWTVNPVPGAADTSPAAEQAYFSAFFSPEDRVPYANAVGDYVTNQALSIQTPFTPTRVAVQHIVYEANDPLVHYLTSDLVDFPASTNSIALKSPSPPTLAHVGHVNDRYMPWGIAGNLGSVGLTDNNSYNLSYKDPLVVNSDSWNFPTNETLADTSWLGQVHRGTPWQTIFLKSTNILNLVQTIPNGPTYETGLATWQLWTGDLNAEDASNTAPVQDWHMASYLASLFETNYPSLFSVNDANLGDWENLMNGMTVLSNDVLNAIVQSGFHFTPQFATLIVSSNDPQAAVISSAVESTRAAQHMQYFTNVGDIFGIPQLSDFSPYLNTNINQVQKAISDEAYEAIPAQLLALLRADSIGSIVAANGLRIIQFTGDDNHTYAVQISCDLTHWTTLSTNCPVGGSFTITNTVTAKPQFYRTFLVQ